MNIWRCVVALFMSGRWTDHIMHKKCIYCCIKYIFSILIHNVAFFLTVMNFAINFPWCVFFLHKTELGHWAAEVYHCSAARNKNVPRKNMVYCSYNRKNQGCVIKQLLTQFTCPVCSNTQWEKVLCASAKCVSYPQRVLLQNFLSRLKVGISPYTVRRRCWDFHHHFATTNPVLLPVPHTVDLLLKKYLNNE